MDRGSCQAIIDERRETWRPTVCHKRKMGRRGGAEYRVRWIILAAHPQVSFHKFEVNCHRMQNQRRELTIGLVFQMHFTQKYKGCS